MKKEVLEPIPDNEKKSESDLKTEELEEVLSDISDEAEEILNKPSPKDTDVTSKDTPAETNAISNEPESHKATIADVPAFVIKAITEGHTSGDSKSKTNEVDVLDEFDLEEISDDELGEPERKTGIVDALGVDWSSLINTQKGKNEQSENEEEKAKKISLRDRWSPANRFKLAGLPRSLFGESFSVKFMVKYKRPKKRMELNLKKEQQRRSSNSLLCDERGWTGAIL